jgi:hypothetical protein
MVSQGRHQKKEVADALRRAEEVGLSIEYVRRNHRWAEVRCESCDSSRDVWSTPRDPGTHAKQIDRFTSNHRH